jgi:hypothetical protein
MTQGSGVVRVRSLAMLGMRNFLSVYATLMTGDWRLATPYSTSSIDLGQSSFNSRDIARSASSRPPVWQRAQ